MIVCEHCRSAQFLQITHAKVRIGKQTRRLKAVEEEYECTRCEVSGTYSYEDGEESISGSILSTKERPATTNEALPGGAA